MFWTFKNKNQKNQINRYYTGFYDISKLYLNLYIFLFSVCFSYDLFFFYIVF